MPPPDKGGTYLPVAMNFEEAESCGIRIYVPDTVIRQLGDWRRGSFLEPDVQDLEFVMPGWWERSHTHWCGPIQSPPFDHL